MHLSKKVYHIRYNIGHKESYSVVAYICCCFHESASLTKKKKSCWGFFHKYMNTCFVNVTGVLLSTF